MHRRNWNFWWLLTGFGFISALGWLINNIAPNTIYIVGMFLILILGTITSYTLFFTNNVRRSIYLGLFTVIVLALRYLNLRDFLYIVLLLTIFVTLELYFQKK
jgi:hypothetical protein